MLTVAEKWGCGWIKDWFKYVEGQTADILINLLVLPVRYVSVMIQRRSGTLRLWNLASGLKQVQWHFPEFEADYRGSESREYHVQSQRQLNLEERESIPKIKLSIISKQGWTGSRPVQLSKAMKSARIFETSEWKFRIVIQTVSISFRHYQCRNKNSSPTVLHTLHSTDVIPHIYWCYHSNVLNTLHSTEAIPTVLMLSPHCTEEPPQYKRYPPQYWSYPPHVPNNFHSTEAIPHSTEANPHSTEAILHSTDVIAPPPAPRCTEQPPLYWTDVIWGGNLGNLKAGGSE